MENVAIIVNTQTGEVVERPLTAGELEQKELDTVEVKRRQDQIKAIELKKESALVKLAALGLTSEDLKALGL